MASWRSVFIALAIAAGLWGLTIATRSPGPARDMRVPLSDSDSDSDSDAITSMTLTVGGASATLTKSDSTFFLEGRPVSLVVTESLLATLEYAHGRRFLSGGGGDAELGLDNNAPTLTVRTSVKEQTFRRGKSVADGSLVWVGRGDDALLISSTEANFLFPDPSSIADPRVLFLGGIAARRVVVTRAKDSLTLEGRPLSMILDGARARLKASAVRSRLSALREMTFDSKLPPRPANASVLSSNEQTQIEITAGGRAANLVVVGSCADASALVDASIGGISVGRGCVRADIIAEWTELLDDPTPILAGLIDPSRTVELARLIRDEGSVEIDPDGDGSVAARSWLALLSKDIALATSAQTGPPVGAIELVFDDGSADRIELEVIGEGQLRARLAGQPLAWRIGEAAAKRLLGAQSYQFRSLMLISRDPSELVGVAVDSRKLDVLSIERSLRDRLVHLEAQRFVASSANRSHGLAPARRAITLEFAPPPVETGDQNTVIIELGAGCHARLKNDPVVFELDRATCTALKRL